MTLAASANPVTIGFAAAAFVVQSSCSQCVLP
jgi:hypothetical protein